MGTICQVKVKMQPASWGKDKTKTIEQEKLPKEAQQTVSGSTNQWM